MLNLGLVYVGSLLISDAEDFLLGTGLFFAFLIALLTTLYRYRHRGPLHVVEQELEAAQHGGVAPSGDDM